MDWAGPGLVADIGRVSVRFGLVDAGGGEPRAVRTFHTADHPTFTDALIGYLDGAGLRHVPLASVLAVAGAVRGDAINLTGSRWYISLSGVEAVLRSPSRAINECAATALALTALDATAFAPLSGRAATTPRLPGSYLVVSIGTGLGAAGLVGRDGRWTPVQSEAGHMRFVAHDAATERFARHVCRGADALEFETVLSAAGLSAAYAAFGGAAGTRPEAVTGARSSDPAAAAAMQLFVDTLGRFLADLTLALGAWDGVYLTGAIARACRGHLVDLNLRRNLEAKVSFRRQLVDLPLAVVTRSDLELGGAAAALRAGTGPLVTH